MCLILHLSGKREAVHVLNFQKPFLKFVKDFKTSTVSEKLTNKLDVMPSYCLSQYTPRPKLAKVT